MTHYLKKHMQEILTDELGEINEYMGSIRSTVKASLDTERERKIVYRKVLQTLLERKEAGEDIDLSEREWQEILDGEKSQKDNVIQLLMTEGFVTEQIEMNAAMLL